MKKFITHIAPCIEVVGYRQKKKGIKSFGDLCSDFGANVKFILGPRKRFRNNNVTATQRSNSSLVINNITKSICPSSGSVNNNWRI